MEVCYRTSTLNTLLVLQAKVAQCTKRPLFKHSMRQQNEEPVFGRQAWGGGYSSIKPELNLVQSIGLSPQSQNRTAHKSSSEDFDTVCSLAESKTSVSSSDSESSSTEKKRGETMKVPAVGTAIVLTSGGSCSETVQKMVGCLSPQHLVPIFAKHFLPLFLPRLTCHSPMSCMCHPLRTKG